MQHTYDLYEFQGQKVLFTPLRVKYLEEPVPKDLEVYEIRHSDEGFEACQLARNIWINHYGTLFAYEKIQLDHNGYLDFEESEDFIDLNESMSFEAYRQVMAQEMKQEEDTHINGLRM